MKGLPLGVPETTSGFWGSSIGCAKGTLKTIPMPSCDLSSPKKHAIDPKVGRIVAKVGREKSVSQPKIRKTPRNFMPFLTAKVCFRCATTAKLSDNVRPTAGQQAILAGG